MGELVARAAKAVDRFEAQFRETYDLRKRVLKVLGRVTHKDNITFDGRPACRTYVTDATDWRVEYPFVVLHPDSGTGVWPGQRLHRAQPHHHSRGGGTGYTGGAIPAVAAVGGDQYRKAGDAVAGTF